MYNNIDSIPLSNYTDCLCDQSFAPLYKNKNIVLHKKFSKDLINKVESEVYEDLYIEFIDRLFGKKNSILSDKKKQAILYSKLTVINAILNVCRNGLNVRMKKVVKKYGVILTEDTEQNIIAITAIAEKLVRQIEELDEKIKNDMAKGSKWNREFFIDVLNSYRDVEKVHVPFSEISAGEFCSLYNNLKTKISKLKTK